MSQLTEADRLFLDQAVASIKQNEGVSEQEACRLLADRLRRFASIAQIAD